MSEVSIKDIITPSLLDTIHKTRFPWPIDKPLNALALSHFNPQGEIQKIRDLCLTTLKALSQIDLNNIPDLLQCLPAPEAPTFPEQALGALLLLDQVTRNILSGIDSRWTHAYFDVLARRLLSQLRGLPAPLQPDNAARWEVLGYSFDNVVLRRSFFLTPLVHSEDVVDQMVQLKEVEELQRATEEYYGLRDVRREEDVGDVTAFYRVVRNPPVYSPEAVFGEFAFFWFHVYRTHETIVRTFGRFPYRNAYFGRETTEEEEGFLRKTNYMAVPSKEVVKKLRDDIKDKRWSQIQGQ